MKTEFIYLIYIFFAALLVFIIMTIVAACVSFAEKKRQAFQKIDEQIRKDVDDAIAFLEDETDLSLSEEKRQAFQLLIITRLKKSERKNKNAIKKLIREEILRQQTEKKEQLRLSAVKQIFRDVLTSFRLEFFRKVKKIIASAKNPPKTKNSRIQEQRRREAEEQRQRSNEEQQERKRAEQEKQKNEQERKKESEERIKNAREKEEALEKERQEQEKERKKQEEEEKRRQEQEQQKQKQQQRQKQNEQAAKAAAVGGRGGNGGR